jgi:hypothetical protein
MRGSRTAVAGFLFGLGCATMRGATPAQATTDYYEGTSTALLPTGRSVPNGVILARRTVDPSAGTIVEQVVNDDRRRPPAEYVIEMRVQGRSFTMRAADGSSLGEGTLDGDPWRWRVWRSTSRLPGGLRVESVDTLSGGVLVAHKTIFGADGAVMLRTTEQLSPISATRFGERRTELLRAGGPRSPTDGQPLLFF